MTEASRVARANCPLRTMKNTPSERALKLLLATMLILATASTSLRADSTTISNPPMNLAPGSTVGVKVNYSAASNAILTLQLVDSGWNQIYNSWVNVPAGNGSKTFSLPVPAAWSPGGGYIWQAVLSTPSWSKLAEHIVPNVTVGAGSSGSEWLPPGSWTLDWSDEFEGAGAISKWYPFLGYTPEDFGSKSEFPLRWTGPTADTASMYSTKTGNHWLNGQGQMVMQMVNDKTQSNANGTRVKGAYLLSGYPQSWKPDGKVNWAGKFVSPGAGPLYISARLRTDGVVGHSTWFAFWLFTKSSNSSGSPIAYDGIGSNGTEVDMLEIAKGAPAYMARMFNVAHHWSLANGGNEQQMFTTSSNPASTSFVDVMDSNYHVYGIEWTTTSMKCYVDGKLYKTFTSNIPSNPADMMMFLTLEFQKNLWHPAAGDGRTSGPYISDNASTRVMSRIFVDYVRVYKKN